MSKITVTELQGHTSGGDANKVKIATGHNLGVNTGSGSIDARLHVESHTNGHLAKFEGVANAQNHRVIIDASGTSSSSGLQISNSNSNNAGSFYWSGGNNTLNLQVGQTAGSEPTSGTNALVVDSTGRHMLPAGIVLGNGSTYAAANHLEDYEEGTWTPAWSNGSGQTYTYQYGSYVKIGRLVTISCWITTSDMNGQTGDAAISGLPFTASSATFGSFPRAWGTVNGDNNWDTNLSTNNMVAQISGGDDKIRPRYNSGLNTSDVQLQQIGGGNSYFGTTVTYETDS